VKDKNQINNLLVIGGTGFIGYNILRYMSKPGWKLTSASRKKPSKKRIVKKVKYLKIDINKKIEIKKKLNKNYSHIINLVGNTKNIVSRKNKNFIVKNQYESTKNIIDFFKKKKIKKFIQVGSAAEYGSLKLPHKESKQCFPISEYGKEKLKATKYLIKNSKKNSMPSLIIRLFQVYGPGQSNDKIVPYILNSCLFKKQFIIKNKNSTRDFIHINDMCNAVYILLKNKNLKKDIFNLASGKETSIKELTNIIKKKVGKGNPLFETAKNNYNQIKKSKACIKNIKSVGWKPKITLDKGITSMIKNNHEK